MKALQKEWDKLRHYPYPAHPCPVEWKGLPSGKPAKAGLSDEQKPNTDVWLEWTVRESADVHAEARRNGWTVHFGRIAQLAFVRNSELLERHPDRREKGHCVFLGDSVRDEQGSYAIF